MSNKQSEASEFLSLADRLSRLEQPFRTRKIATCLASAYRRGKESVEAKPTTKEIIEACGGDWVLEAWDEDHPEDFVLAVMRLMREEQQRWW